ncbi:hypothetical protein SBADM41S_00267 [Streptomyces badius]
MVFGATPGRAYDPAQRSAPALSAVLSTVLGQFCRKSPTATACRGSSGCARVRVAATGTCTSPPGSVHGTHRASPGAVWPPPILWTLACVTEGIAREARKEDARRYIVAASIGAPLSAGVAHRGLHRYDGGALGARGGAGVPAGDGQGARRDPGRQREGRDRAAGPRGRAAGPVRRTAEGPGRHARGLLRQGRFPRRQRRRRRSGPGRPGRGSQGPDSRAGRERTRPHQGPTRRQGPRSTRPGSPPGPSTSRRTR